MKTKDFELRSERGKVVTTLRPVRVYPNKTVGVEITRCYNGESWSTWLLLDGHWDEEDVETQLNVAYYYGGPGRPFAEKPQIERNRFSTLVYQSGGWDI